jgi:hypothetical protein
VSEYRVARLKVPWRQRRLERRVARALWCERARTAFCWWPPEWRRRFRLIGEIEGVAVRRFERRVFFGED